MVTGSAGFVGGHLMRGLADSGHDASGIDRETDITSMDGIADALLSAQPEVVIHCAAVAGVAECDRDHRTAFATNVIGTFTVASAAAAIGVRRFIHVSTGGNMYGSRSAAFSEWSRPDPPSYYGETKLMSEAAVTAAVGDSGMQVVILRPANIYGPGGRGAVESIAAAMIGGGPVRITGHGAQERDYIHIDDVVALVARIVDADTDSLAAVQPGVFNVGTGERHTVLYIVERLRQLLGWDGEIVHEPARLFDPDCAIIDAQHAADVFGWRADIPFAQGIDTAIPVRA